jgi:uncharacterized membrane protein HdeD (DUF308 family)
MALPTSPMLDLGIDRVASKWGWFVALGILLVIVGSIAISSSVLATAVTVVVFGWLLIVTGVFETFAAFSHREWSGSFLHLLGGAIDIVLGFLFIMRPLQGAEVLTLFLSALFLVGGAFRIGAALSKRLPGWQWGFVNGLITFVLGVLLWTQWPVSGLWFIGFCIGLEMIFRGWFWLMLGFALKSSKPAAA